MLHGYSKPLELSWLDLFGSFGIGEQTVSQLVYDLWYIQDRLKEFFHVTWHLLVGEECKDPLPCKFILSPWGYPLKTCTMVDSICEKWFLFLSKLVESEPHSSALRKTVKDSWGLIQNPETKINIKFLVSFGKFY